MAAINRCFPSLAFATMILISAHPAWLMSDGFGESKENKEKLKLDYDLTLTDYHNGRVYIKLTLADEGRLKPLTSIDLVIPSKDGTGYVDLWLCLAITDTQGKRIATCELSKELANVPKSNSKP